MKSLAVIDSEIFKNNNFGTAAAEIDDSIKRKIRDSRDSLGKLD